MKIYTYIYYLLVLLSIMIVKAVQNPSSSQKTSAVKADTDKTKPSFLSSNELRKNYESYLCEFMKTLDHKDSKTPYSFDSALKDFESLIKPSEEFKEIFDEQNIEKIESLKDLVLKIENVKTGWNELHSEFRTSLDKGLKEHINEEIESAEGLYNGLDLEFNNVDNGFKRLRLLICAQSKKFPTNIDEFARKEFISLAKEFDNIKILNSRENSIKFLKSHNISCYNKLEKLKVSLRCLNYNIYSLSLNYFEAFFKGKRLENERTKFRNGLLHFLYLFESYVECNYYFEDHFQSMVLSYRSSQNH